MKIRVEDRNHKPATLRECRAAISRDRMHTRRERNSVSYSFYLNKGADYKFVRVIVDGVDNVNPAKLVDRWISKSGPDALLSEVSKSIGAKGKESKKDTSEVDGSTQTGDQSHGGQHASKEVENSANSAENGKEDKSHSGGDSTSDGTQADDSNGGATGGQGDGFGRDRESGSCGMAQQDASLNPDGHGKHTSAVEDGGRSAGESSVETAPEKDSRDLTAGKTQEDGNNHVSEEQPEENPDHSGDKSPALPSSSKLGGIIRRRSVKSPGRSSGCYLTLDRSASIPFRTAKRLKAALEALIKERVVGVDESSPRVDARKLVTEIVSKRYNMGRVRRQDSALKPALLAIDVSGSCHVSCNYVFEVAVAIAAQMPDRVKLLIHSNGLAIEKPYAEKMVKEKGVTGVNLANGWFDSDWSLCLAWGDLDAESSLNKIGSKCTTYLFDDFGVKTRPPFLRKPTTARNFTHVTAIRGADGTLHALNMIKKTRL